MASHSEPEDTEAQEPEEAESETVIYHVEYDAAYP